MIVNRDRERLFGDVLADNILVERSPDVGRLGHADVRRLPPRVLVQLLIEDTFADVYAAIANVDTGTGDELSDFGVAFATEGAHREVGSASHNFPVKKAASIPPLCAATPPPRPP